MKITVGAAAPAPNGIQQGFVYYNIKDQKFYRHDTGNWVEVPKEQEESLFLIFFGLEMAIKNADGRYDCPGNVKIVGVWDRLPITFGKIDGTFDCSRVGLKSMVNMPTLVIGDFLASANKFITCDGMPTVCGKINLSGNKLLKDFRGLPAETTDDIDVSNCGVHSHYGLPKLIKGNLSATNNEFRTIPEGIEVHGDADFTSNKIITDQTGSKITGKIWLDDNPCTAENDNIKENAIWS